MNKKAEELNMTNTHFSNPIGMDENNYSTVNEIAILLKYALKNDTFYKIYKMNTYIYINSLAMDYLLGRFHGYWRNPSNFLIYYHPALSRYVIFPVDFTSTLGYKYNEIYNVFVGKNII